MKFTTIVLAALMLLTLGLLTTACGSSQADVAAKNISKAAEQFEVARNIVGINTMTDTYLWQVEGYCSVETASSGLAGALEVTCKLGSGKYKKLFFGITRNVTYVVQQIDPINVSTSHYRVLFRPGTVVPNYDNHN